MSEAIISRRGSKGGSGTKGPTFEFITTSSIYTIPSGIVNNQIAVRIFGGGGGGGYGFGGFGSGGCSNEKGRSGICIIQYYL